MTDLYQKRPFRGLSAVEAPFALRAQVRERIQAIEKRRSLVSVSLFYALAVSSAGAVVASSMSIWHSFASTGAYQLVSLAFSDSSMILSYPKELLLSVVESLPVLGIAAALAAVLALGWSVSRLVARYHARQSAFMFV